MKDLPVGIVTEPDILFPSLGCLLQLCPFLLPAEHSPPSPLPDTEEDKVTVIGGNISSILTPRFLHPVNWMWFVVLCLTWSNFFCLFSKAVQFCLSLCRASVMSSISSLRRSLCLSTLSFSSSFCRSLCMALSSSLWSFLRVSSPASTAVFTSSDCLRSSASCGSGAMARLVNAKKLSEFLYSLVQP